MLSTNENELVFSGSHDSRLLLSFLVFIQICIVTVELLKNAIDDSIHSMKRDETPK